MKKLVTNFRLIAFSCLLLTAFTSRAQIQEVGLRHFEKNVYPKGYNIYAGFKIKNVGFEAGLSYLDVPGQVGHILYCRNTIQRFGLSFSGIIMDKELTDRFSYRLTASEEVFNVSVGKYITYSEREYSRDVLVNHLGLNQYLTYKLGAGFGLNIGTSWGRVINAPKTNFLLSNKAFYTLTLGVKYDLSHLKNAKNE